MTRQVLKDARYRIVGYIDSTSDGRQKGLNARYEVVGHYDPARNETKDARFRVVARGNALSALVFSSRN